MYTLQHKNPGYELTFKYLDHNQTYINTLRESVSKRLKEIDIDISVIRGDDDICLIIDAKKIETLSEIMQREWSHSKKYNLLIQVIHGISSQMLFLIANGICFYNLSIDNILVIDDKTAVYISPHLLPLIYSQSKQYTFMSLNNIPANQHNLYASPELRDVVKLPTKLPISSIYWSLASVILHCLFFSIHIDKLFKYNRTQLQLLMQCLHIRETRLFYLLRRCFEPDYSRRSLLYI